MRSRQSLVAAIVLFILPLVAQPGLAQDPATTEWILVADKLSLLRKYIEGSDLGRNMRDLNLRARLTAPETMVVFLPPPRASGSCEVRINVIRSTRLETLPVPREDYDALVKFARTTALEQPGEGAVLKR